MNGFFQKAAAFFSAYLDAPREDLEVSDKPLFDLRSEFHDRHSLLKNDVFRWLFGRGDFRARRFVGKEVIFCASRVPLYSRDYFTSHLGLRNWEVYSVESAFRDGRGDVVFGINIEREEAYYNIVSGGFEKSALQHRVYVSSRFFDLPRKAR